MLSWFPLIAEKTVARGIDGAKSWVRTVFASEERVQHRRLLYQRMTHAIALQDISEAVKWVEEQEGEFIDHGLRIVSERWGQSDPAAALDWVTTNSSVHTQMNPDVRRVLKNWLRDDEAAALEWIERNRGDEDLFDVLADPYELEDLSDRPELGAEKERLREDVLAWWRATGGGELALP